MGLEIPNEGEITNGDLNYNDLIEYIDDGVIHIPEFQREFVWPEQKILSLLDSIYKSYPVGSLIFWVTSEDFDYSAPIGNNESPDSIHKHRFFVIDGQQRLKSLYHAAKNQELEMERGPKRIDVVFDLEDENFILEQNIHNRRKSMHSIPGIKSPDMFFEFLDAVKNDSTQSLCDNLDLNDGPKKRFLGSLNSLGFITHRDDTLELTQLGENVLSNKDNELAASVLVDNAKFIKEALEIVKENPGISRRAASTKFQDVYGKSEETTYYQFGRRARWFRALNLVTKTDGNLYLTDSGAAVLDHISEVEREIKTRYVPLDRILIDQAEIDFDYLSNFPEERRNKINDLRKTFSDYELSIILVNKTNWEEVCDIFERINTEGEHLTVVDLMIAKTWSGEEFNLRDELAMFKDEIDEDIPDITILQAVSINICGKCRRQDILGLSSKDVKNHWEEVIESLRKSIDFLENNINIPTLDLLPYPAQLVPLSRFFYLIGNEEPSRSQKDKVLRWFWKSSISSRYDSAVETKLEEDRKSIEAVVEKELVEFQYTYPQRSVDDIISLEYSLRNAFVKTIICLFSSQEPVNPVNNTPISPDNFSRYKKSEMHHIFPRNYLTEQNIDNDLIDSVANVMFLPSNINKQSEFSDSPADYLDEINNPHLEDALETHLIPNLEESGLTENDYHHFLKYRAKNILNKIDEVTGEKDILRGGMELDPKSPFRNEMYIREIVRQSDGYVHWFDKYFTRRGLEFLVKEIDPDDVTEIRILTGTAQTTHRLRKDFEKFQTDMSEHGVETEMRVILGDLAHEIHDRWIIAENHVYNIPSINTIGRNQHTEITEAAARPPFSDWWDESYDILDNWNEIQKYLD